jgi:hypothetical protein
VRPAPPGESATNEVVVTPEMTVPFDELGPVHPVYATYTMAKHFEEAGRKLLLQHLEPGEDGIGRSVREELGRPRRRPAPPGEGPAHRDRRQEVARLQPIPVSGLRRMRVPRRRGLGIRKQPSRRGWTELVLARLHGP